MSFVIHFNDFISKTLHGTEESARIEELLQIDPDVVATMTWDEIRKRGLEVKGEVKEESKINPRLAYLLETLEPTIGKPEEQQIAQELPKVLDLPENKEHLECRLQVRAIQIDMESVHMNVTNHMNDCAFANSIPNEALYDRLRK